MKHLIPLLALLLPTFASAETILILDKGRPIGSGVTIASEGNLSLAITAKHVCDGSNHMEATNLKFDPVPAVVTRIHSKQDLCEIVLAHKTSPTPIGDMFLMTIDLFHIHTLFPGPLQGTEVPIKNLSRENLGPGYESAIVFEGNLYPGMSGSPILNSKGQLVGILVLGERGAPGQEIFDMGAFVELQYIHELIRGVFCFDATNPALES